MRITYGGILKSVLEDGDYPGVSPDDIAAVTQKAEAVFKQLGAERAVLSSGPCWTLNGEYFRVDLLCFPEKPFLVIEWASCLDDAIANCFEDADPFPWDLTDEELFREISEMF